jgi:7-cyano-7-deazaguanine synthase
MEPIKAIVVTSGGMDSAVLLHKMVKDLGRENVKALSFCYGQRHQRELLFAKRLCKDLKVNWKLADISSIRELLGNSSQTNSKIAVPEGHYEAENMKLTVVPNRNMIMLSIAVGYALSSKFNLVAYGAHAGDHHIYPDCRPEFVDALQGAVDKCDWEKVKIERPFIKITKAQIVGIGLELGVPFQYTYSCYSGKKKPDGCCGTCVERTLAFLENGVKDPALSDKEWWAAVKYAESLKK